MPHDIGNNPNLGCFYDSKLTAFLHAPPFPCDRQLTTNDVDPSGARQMVSAFSSTSLLSESLSAVCRNAVVDVFEFKHTFICEGVIRAVEQCAADLRVSWALTFDSACKAGRASDIIRLVKQFTGLKKVDFSNLKMSSDYTDEPIDDQLLQFCAEHGISHLQFASLGCREAMFSADGIIQYLLNSAMSSRKRKLTFDGVDAFPSKSLNSSLR